MDNRLTVLAALPQRAGPSAQPSAQPTAPESAKDAALRAKARDLEATFLAEMLKHTGIGENPESFGGGVGEEQFSSFLTDEYARIMAEAGGIGLAESIFHSLQKGAENAQ